MRRLSWITLAAAVVLVLAWPVVLAGNLERALESRWLGAWVVTGVETYSDCSGFFTTNTVNGRLVSGRGRLRFKAGELARITKVDAKRSSVQLKLTYGEPVLLSRQEGPFTLYDEAGCRVEMEVEVPRDLVKRDDVGGLEAALSQALERYATEDEARQSKVWNRRKRDPFPADYARTLARHAAWKAEQVNKSVAARLDQARDEAGRVSEKLNEDPDYLGGFTRGVEAARAAQPPNCPGLLGSAIGDRLAKAPTMFPGETEKQNRWARGFQDGQRLVYSLEALRLLPGCFVEVPDPDAQQQNARY